MTWIISCLSRRNIWMHSLKRTLLKYFFLLKSLSDAVKVSVWFLLRPVMSGTVGGQCVLYVLRKSEYVKGLMKSDVRVA
jgi:hypothetical protein